MSKMGSDELNEAQLDVPENGFQGKNSILEVEQSDGEYLSQERDPQSSLLRAL